jgi:UDP-N-acetylmuramoyl-L-alanyl-D-glutamate--2,6-diaminopimelate ligase
MKTLYSLLKNVKVVSSINTKKIIVESIQTNSKKVHKGDLFISLENRKGLADLYISEALKRGAMAILSERKLNLKNNKLVSIEVNDVKKALVTILNNFYPSLRKINVIGVTGTNGKTTVTHLLKNILEASGYKCGLIGTLGWKISDGRLNELTNTTPGPLELAQIIDIMADKKVRYLIMEVSSHALSQDRVACLDFKAAIFTNLSQDHLDYHKNMKNYLEAKKLLFKKMTKDGLTFLNADDKVFKQVKQVVKGKSITYGLNKECDYKAEKINLSLNKTSFEINCVKRKLKVNSKLCGIHNIYNMLASAACALELHCPHKKVEAALNRTRGVAGRLQKVIGKSKKHVYIDYAHTPDAIKNVTGLLSSLKNVNSKLISLMGCGGDRDKKKRPKMGKEAAANSDILIVTSDNPRSEDPSDIIRDIKKGISVNNLKKCYFIIEREKAIKRAIKLAGKEDIVLIAGKGHENYQILKNKVIPFSDYDIARKILNEE